MNIAEAELIYSMRKNIEERINTERERLQSFREKLNNPKDSKIGTLDKLFLKRDIKDIEQKISDLTRLQQMIASLSSAIEVEKSVLSDDLMSAFQELTPLLSEEERKKIAESVKESVRETNKDKREIIQQNIDDIKKIISKLKIDSKSFLIYNFNDTYLGETIPFNVCLEKIRNEKFRDLISNYISFHTSDIDKTESKSEDILLIEKLEEMISDNEFLKDKKSESIIDNIDKIKEALFEKERIEQLLVAISKTILNLNDNSEIDFSNLKELLKSSEEKYRKELKKINEFLSEFDFEYIREQVRLKKEQEERERLEEQEINKYEQLIYELEKVMTETPNDYDKINQLREQIRTFSSATILTQEQLQAANVSGKTRYVSEVAREKAQVSAIKEKIEYEDQLKADVMAQLREYAISELEYSNAFADNYEYRNGDVYSIPKDREAMIQAKIEELQKLAEMTPEQRGLYELKKRGVLKAGTTVEDLTPQQLMDFRMAYRDESYGFMSSYKKWKAREEIKPQANEVYKEYLKYRFSLEDKTQFLSFSDYAKQFHNIENMSEIMVDEELTEQLKGVSK